MRGKKEGRKEGSRSGEEDTGRGKGGKVRE